LEQVLNDKTTKDATANFKNLFKVSECAFFCHDYRDFHDYWIDCVSEKS